MLEQLIANLADIRARKSENAAAAKLLNEEEAAVERQVLGAMDAAGLTGDGAKVSSDMGTVSRRTKWRAAYDPEKWTSLVAWCVANDRTDLIQRRLADTRVLELVDNGKPLPDGVSMTSYTDLSFHAKR